MTNCNLPFRPSDPQHPEQTLLMPPYECSSNSHCHLYTYLDPDITGKSKCFRPSPSIFAHHKPTKLEAWEWGQQWNLCTKAVSHMLHNYLIFYMVTKYNTRQSLQECITTPDTHPTATCGSYTVKWYFLWASHKTNVSTCVAELTQAPAWRSIFTTVGWPWEDPPITTVIPPIGEVKRITNSKLNQ